MDSPGPPRGEGTPTTSFILLEGRESLPDVLSPSVDAAPRRGGSRLLNALSRRTPPLAAAGSGEVVTMDGFQQRPREDSISDLFPMNVSVFTNPENIMPSRQDSILIDTDLQQQEQQMMQNSNTLMPAGSQFLNGSQSTATIGSASINSSTLFAYPSTGSVLHAVYEQTGKGTTTNTNGSREPSFEGDHVFQDIANSIATSRASASGTAYDKDEVGIAGRKRCWCGTTHASPRQWLASLWERLTNDWDTIFQMGTLAVSICSVPIAVTIAWALDSSQDLRFGTRCRLSATSHVDSPSVPYLAAVLIPIMNYAVLFVVSLWVGILCSRSRKRVLKSGPAAISSNLTSAFMLPCYEPIWYCISCLSAIGLILYLSSYTVSTDTDPDAPRVSDLGGSAGYPCNVATLPFVWVLQLLPMLMIQRSVSQEAVVRAIVYSGGVCIVMVICYVCLFNQGRHILDSISTSVHLVLLAFYIWAKFGFHARATFDFFFVMAVVSAIANVTVHTMGIVSADPNTTIPITQCVVGSLDAMIMVSILLSLRADTRYWLAIDDGNGGTGVTSNAMKRYVRLLSERGLITNFSTRTSVYDVHRMIEEHRKNVVDFSALQLDCVIAQGATSIVMRGSLRQSGTAIALKIYTSVQVTYEEVQRFSRETALNVQLSHPNVVRFYGLCVVPPSISLIFEFCEYGGLDVALRATVEGSTSWSLSTKLKAWLDACKAVAYLHSFSPPLLHRDIKTDNFLIGQDYLLKLADFGEANLLRPRSDGTMTIAGTVDYMAPEMIIGGKTARYGTAVDVYSLMITLWQILVPDRSPWGAKTHLEVYQCVTNGERPPLLPTIPRGCADILVAGWAPNPADRVSVDEVIPKVHRLWLYSLHQKKLTRTK